VRRRGKQPQELTLVDVLIDGFEKNEILGGFHWRSLPMPSQAEAIRAFGGFLEEGRRWKGTPTRVDLAAGRRLVAWEDMEIRQAGRGVLVRVRAPWLEVWWNHEATWAGDPMKAIDAWIKEEAK
jgi:hypothetical protein